MKIVIIGGGSYVFAPSVIDDVIVKARLTNFELVLVDLNLEAAQTLATIATQIATDYGITANITATTDRIAAIKDANFVITSVAIQGGKRWLMDYAICKEECIPYDLRETGALSGISYGIRAITLIGAIARDMEQHCPQAILLNVSNPLTRVHEAISRYTSIESYGFCNVAQRGSGGYLHIAEVLGVDATDIDVVTAGLNHFSWVVSITCRKTGTSLLEDYIGKVFTFDYAHQYQKDDAVVMQRWYNAYGMVTAPPTGHSGDYLPYQGGIHYMSEPPFHGNEAERAARTAQMADIAAGRLSYKNAECFTNASWEHPGLVAATMLQKGALELPILNLVNGVSLPQLPGDAVVEVPVSIKEGIMTPATGILLTDPVVELCLNQYAVGALVAKAAVEGDRAAALQAVEIDQALSNKTAATKAMDRMLDAHLDILPQFN